MSHVLLQQVTAGVEADVEVARDEEYFEVAENAAAVAGFHCLFVVEDCGQVVLFKVRLGFFYFELFSDEFDADVVFVLFSVFEGFSVL